MVIYYKYNGGYSDNIYYYNFDHSNLDRPKNLYSIFEEIKLAIDKYYKFNDSHQNSVYLLYILNY